MTTPTKRARKASTPRPLLKWGRSYTFRVVGRSGLQIQCCRTGIIRTQRAPAVLYTADSRPPAKFVGMVGSVLTYKLSR